MILVNGVATDLLAATDRGLAYGDGVFRTFPVSGGRTRHWHLQYHKLAEDCAALALHCPEESVLAEELQRVCAAHPECNVKIMVTRGSGERGYAPPQPAAPRHVVIASPPSRHPAEFSREGVRIRICSTRVAAQSRLAGVKHLNRLENVLARMEWSDPAVAEGLMLDAEGNVVGGTMTNLFMVDDEGLATPDLSNCGVAGVTRARVLAGASRHGVNCRIEPLPLNRVLDARELILVNSVIGAWPVRDIDGRTLRPGDGIVRVTAWLGEDDD